MNNLKFKSSGFTLVEVLVAITLFITLIAGLIGLTQLSVRATDASRLRVKSGNILQQTMEAVMAVRASNFSSLDQGIFHPEIVSDKWNLISGTEIIDPIDSIERWVEISRVQREVSCGGERVCPVVDSGGIVDPVTFKARVVVSWQEHGQDQQQELESFLTFWR